MGQRLKEKVALVCGAGSVGEGWGNGKAAATLFAREGAHGVCIDNDPARAAETVGIISGEGNRATADTCDVVDGTKVAAAVERTIAVHGRIDVLHNNVGYDGGLCCRAA